MDKSGQLNTSLDAANIEKPGNKEVTGMSHKMVQVEYPSHADNSTSTSDLASAFSQDIKKKKHFSRIINIREFSHKFVPKCDLEQAFSASYKPRLQENMNIGYTLDDNKLILTAATTPCEKEIEKRLV